MKIKDTMIFIDLKVVVDGGVSLRKFQYKAISIDDARTRAYSSLPETLVHREVINIVDLSKLEEGVPYFGEDE
jgi:hypothetical protein